MKQAADPVCGISRLKGSIVPQTGEEYRSEAVDFVPKSITRIVAAFEGCPNLTIHAPAGSYAKTYAKEHNIPFVAE